MKDDERFDGLHQALTPDAEMRKRIQGAITRVRNVTNNHDELSEGLVKDPFPQGSYPMYTLTRPVSDGYDIDMALPFTREWWQSLGDDPEPVLDIIIEALKNDAHYAGNLRRRPRCIRVEYAGNFHVDLVPMRERYGSCPLEIPGPNGWEPTHPEALIEWVRETNNTCNGKFIRSVKFLKHWRNENLTGVKVPSIMLTCFAGTHTPIGSQRSAIAYKAARGDCDFFQALVWKLADCALHHGRNFDMPNPVPPRDDLARDMTDIDKDRFRDALTQLHEDVDQAVAEQDPDRSLDLWRGIFGDRFR